MTLKNKILTGIAALVAAAGVGGCVSPDEEVIESVIEEEIEENNVIENVDKEACFDQVELYDTKLVNINGKGVIFHAYSNWKEFEGSYMKDYYVGLTVTDCDNDECENQLNEYNRLDFIDYNCDGSLDRITGVFHGEKTVTNPWGKPVDFPLIVKYTNDNVVGRAVIREGQIIFDDYLERIIDYKENQESEEIKEGLDLVGRYDLAEN